MLRSFPRLVRAQWILWWTSQSVRIAFVACFLPAALFLFVQYSDGKLWHADYSLFLQALLMLSLAPIISGVGSISENLVPLEPHHASTRTLTAVAVPRRSTWAAAHLLVGFFFVVIYLSLALLAGFGVGAFQWSHFNVQALCGLLIYWTVLCWLASFLTSVFQSGTIPLLFLLLNQSVVPLSFLLSRVTPLARWSPDLAAYGLILQGDMLTNSAMSPELAADVAAHWGTNIFVLLAWMIVIALGFSWSEHRKVSS